MNKKRMRGEASQGERAGNREALVVKGVGEVWGRKFLGFSLWCEANCDEDAPRVRRAVASSALERLKQRVRELTQRDRGRSLEQVVQDLRAYLPGWKAYFQLAQTPEVFAKLDAWLRRRLRAMQLKQWKNSATVYREMRRLGASEAIAAGAAAHVGRWWRGSLRCLNTVLTNAYFDRLGVPRLA